MSYLFTNMGNTVNECNNTQVLYARNISCLKEIMLNKKNVTLILNRLNAY